MSDIDELLAAVEKLRAQLHAIIRYKALTDPEVICLSQQLDMALNAYNTAATCGNRPSSRNRRQSVENKLD